MRLPEIPVDVGTAGVALAFRIGKIGSGEQSRLGSEGFRKGERGVRDVAAGCVEGGEGPPVARYVGAEGMAGREEAYGIAQAAESGGGREVEYQGKALRDAAEEMVVADVLAVYRDDCVRYEPPAHEDGQAGIRRYEEDAARLRVAQGGDLVLQRGARGGDRGAADGRQGRGGAFGHEEVADRVLEP